MMKQVLIVAALVASATAFAPAPRPAFVSTTSLNAEWEKEWKETNFEADLAKLQKEAEERLDEKEWKETNFEADLAKLQKEAEERLDEKISELQANIEKTGA
eukprot:CAMPEP_0113456640 /NCGR_PEP_ID=MMETSP0014_2-20120614/8991_1 /TAXON_ID=2857 /ORGANISM="Nitzschia sp." /LENGTH=101 /DNA_ID=CAMNT_0000348099 /DNA_START=86 /DNA_END=391 /DNA_ORIENTATION=- /assembly_acc=CAM_ASM_000159